MAIECGTDEMEEKIKGPVKLLSYKGGWELDCILRAMDLKFKAICLLTSLKEAVCTGALSSTSKRAPIDCLCTKFCMKSSNPLEYSLWSNERRGRPRNSTLTRWMILSSNRHLSPSVQLLLVSWPFTAILCSKSDSFQSTELLTRNKKHFWSSLAIKRKKELSFPGTCVDPYSWEDLKTIPQSCYA